MPPRSAFSNQPECDVSQVRIISTALPFADLRTKATRESIISSVLLNPKFATEDAAKSSELRIPDTRLMPEHDGARADCPSQNVQGRIFEGRVI